MKTDPWYIGERAQALSVVYLTRIPEIQVQQEKYDSVFDLMVEVRQNGISARRFFGVIIKAQESAIADPPTKKSKYPKKHALTSSIISIFQRVFFSLRSKMTKGTTPGSKSRSSTKTSFPSFAQTQPYPSAGSTTPRLSVSSAMSTPGTTRCSGRWPPEPKDTE